jgi:hypothetical protein
MKIYLPHLPSKLDVRICSFLDDLLIIHPFCRTLRIKEMNQKKSKSKVTIDVNTIFGVIRSGFLFFLNISGL